HVVPSRPFAPNHPCRPRPIDAFARTESVGPAPAIAAIRGPTACASGIPPDTEAKSRVQCLARRAISGTGGAGSPHSQPNVPPPAHEDQDLALPAPRIAAARGATLVCCSAGGRKRPK